MSKKLEGKIALILPAVRAALVLQSPSVWPRMERPSSSRTQRTATRLPLSDRNLNSRPAESENRWRQNQGEPKCANLHPKETRHLYSKRSTPCSIRRISLQQRSSGRPTTFNIAPIYHRGATGSSA